MRRARLHGVLTYCFLASSLSVRRVPQAGSYPIAGQFIQLVGIAVKMLVASGDILVICANIVVSAAWISSYFLSTTLSIRSTY